MLKIQTSKEASAGAGHFFLLASKSKLGKTTALKTLKGKTIVINSDEGIVSLKDVENIDFITINESTGNIIKETKEALNLIEKNLDKYDNIALDTLTALSKMYLEVFSVGKKDMRQAYGELNTALYPVVRKLERFARQHGKNVVVTTQIEVTTDQTDKEAYAPSIDGKTLLNKVLLPRFDGIIALEVDNLGKRYFITKPAGKYLVGVRDHKNALSEKEPADFQALFDKLA